MSNTPLSSTILESQRDNALAIRSIEIITTDPGRVALALEDRGHAFRIDFTHNNKVITQIKARWIRYPITTCPGATHQLEKLVGCPLGNELTSLTSFADPHLHCTHFYDAMALARVHAYQQRSDCRYDILINATPNGDFTADLKRNGDLLLSLQTQDYDTISSPALYAERSLFKGFLKWAAGALDSEEFEYAYLIQRAMIVARDLGQHRQSNIGRNAAEIGLPESTCFGTQPTVYQNAVVKDGLRHFSKAPETQVLRFFNPDKPL